MLKISLIVNSNIPSGPINVARDIYESTKSKVNIKFICLKSRFNGLDCFDSYGLIDAFKNNLLNSSLLHTNGFYPDLIGFLCKIFFNKKWISTLHTYIEDDFKYNYPPYYYFYGLIWKYMIKRADTLVVMNSYIYESYSKKGFKNLFLIPNGRGNFTNFKARKCHKPIRLGYIGNFINLKNVMVLPSALKSLDVKLVLAGSGVLQKKLEEALTINKISHEFLGKINEVDSFYNKIDILLLPSKTEASPLVIIEAAQKGIPVLMNHIPHLIDTFGNLGGFIKNWIPNEISIHIEKIIENYNWESKHIYEEWVNSFTRNVMASKYLKVYSYYE